MRPTTGCVYPTRNMLNQVVGVRYNCVAALFMWFPRRQGGRSRLNYAASLCTAVFRKTASGTCPAEMSHAWFVLQMWVDPLGDGLPSVSVPGLLPRSTLKCDVNVSCCVYSGRFAYQLQLFFLISSPYYFSCVPIPVLSPLTYLPMVWILPWCCETCGTWGAKLATSEGFAYPLFSHAWASNRIQAEGGRSAITTVATNAYYQDESNVDLKGRVRQTGVLSSRLDPT